MGARSFALSHFAELAKIPGVRLISLQKDAGDAPGFALETFAGLDNLPDEGTSLFDSVGSFFVTRAWWEIVLAHAVPPHAVPRLVLVRQAGRPCGLFPMLHDAANGELRALTTPYSCLYEPLIAPDVLDRAAVFATFARYCRRFPPF